jgi:SnoaL-like protein
MRVCYPAPRRVARPDRGEDEARFHRGPRRRRRRGAQRTLDEFYQAQKRYLDTGKSIREELENVRVERHGALASVWADFVLTEEGEKSRGRLVLLLIEEHGSFKIHSLMFQYD